MVRIKIKDLPEGVKISASEMRRVRGGVSIGYSIPNSVFPMGTASIIPQNMITINTIRIEGSGGEDRLKVEGSGGEDR